MTHLNHRPYQECISCVMDTTDPDIIFDDKGICNYCIEAEQKKTSKKREWTREEKAEKLRKLVALMKKDGEGKPYDCLIGLSGGVDSSYVTYLLKELGLRALVVHMDNGWNSELSVMNIENILNYTGFDLYTNVLNWKEFRQMQVAYLKAGVLDLEALSDHAINATVYLTAEKYGIKYLVNGSNPKTESILPLKWRYDEKLTDSKNIRGIVSKTTGMKIKSFPMISLNKFLYLTRVKKIQPVPILEYVDFDKKQAMEVIKNKMGWRDYGGKHYESVITRFYQGYILPNKFNIDKRRAHLSSLIVAGQLSKARAEEILKEPYMDPKMLRNDLEFVPKKLKMTKDEFQSVMTGPVRSHHDFPSDKKWREMIFKVNRILFKR